MPIRNKDGSPYRLQGPNPLMESQNLDGEKLIIHNLNPEETVGEDLSRQHRLLPNPFEIVDLQQSVEEFMGNQNPIEEPSVEPEPIISKPELPKPKPKETKAVSNKLIAWCLPAIIKEEINILYGEIKRSITYGDKFSFETVVLNRSVVGCDFWSPIVIEKSSIIYLWDQREWWRVMKYEQQDDGWIITCYPSDHHPSF